MEKNFLKSGAYESYIKTIASAVYQAHENNETVNIFIHPKKLICTFSTVESVDGWEKIKSVSKENFSYLELSEIKNMSFEGWSQLVNPSEFIDAFKKFMEIKNASMQEGFKADTIFCPFCGFDFGYKDSEKEVQLNDAYEDVYREGTAEDELKMNCPECAKNFIVEFHGEATVSVDWSFNIKKERGK